MIDKLGYVCINNHLKPEAFQVCRLNSIRKYGIDYLRDRIIHNLELTKKIIRWNIENEIYMYRVTSDLMPLITHPEVLEISSWRWYHDEKILQLMLLINQLVKKNDIRLSMHPDQFTVINSPKDHVVANSFDYLRYHHDVLDQLGGRDIIIHIGGVYGDKKSAIDRFSSNFHRLDKDIQKMIRIENDDVSYNIDDVLKVYELTGIPIVFDIHHHNCNHVSEMTEKKILLINDTWHDTQMIPKMHISSGNKSRTDRKHADYIDFEDYKNLDLLTQSIKTDLMIEAKKKEQALIKLRNER